MELWIVLWAEEAALPYTWCKPVCLQSGGLADRRISWRGVTAVGSGSIYHVCYSCLRERAPVAFLGRVAAANHIARVILGGREELGGWFHAAVPALSWLLLLLPGLSFGHVSC